MRVIRGDRTLIDSRAKAEPADNVITEDFYTQLSQIRLAADPTSRQRLPETPAEVMLDEIDVGKLVECAVRHPSPNMRYSVLAAIWNHPDSFRQIFRFGLDAPDAFGDIRRIVAEALASRPAVAAGRRAGREPLLPQMPLPAHLRNRERQK